ncbi:hydrophobe/amphiphile efflux-1 (HAE1) family protein [Leptolyngbya sp. NIES-3755]|nr:hydrophobe/amphiphile efflux-1 (HAE1) family protein [Leptolyngbya sp. NIES-3755]
MMCMPTSLMLIGLASKNAILIVKFANQALEHQGVSVTQAALTAARERFRPIVMTSSASLINQPSTAEGVGVPPPAIAGVEPFHQRLKRF